MPALLAVDSKPNQAYTTIEARQYWVLLTLGWRCYQQVCPVAESGDIVLRTLIRMRVFSGIRRGTLVFLRDVLRKHWWLVEARDATGQTLLHCAAARGDAYHVGVLLDFGADANVRSCCGDTPLLLAIEAESTDCVEILCSHTRDVNWSRPRTGLSGLLMAIESGSVPITLLLLQAGADPNKSGAPLLSAIRKGRADLVHALASNGADIEHRLDLGYTPLHHALALRQGEVARTLISLGACVNNVGDDGWTPLHHAAECGDEETLGLLMRKGADPSARIQWGWYHPVGELFSRTFKSDATPLDLAVARPGDYASFLDVLVSYGAEHRTQNLYGETLLHIAAQNNNVECVKRLLTLGESVNAPDFAGMTPLHGASKWGHMKVLAELLAAGADPNRQDHEGNTPLHAAAAAPLACVEALQLLVQGGADPGLMNDHGQTPYDAAVARRGSLYGSWADLLRTTAS